MKIYKTKKIGQPFRQTLSKSGMGIGMLFLSDTTIVQMINETTIQIILWVIVLITLVVVVKDSLKERKTDADANADADAV